MAQAVEGNFRQKAARVRYIKRLTSIMLSHVSCYLNKTIQYIRASVNMHQMHRPWNLYNCGLRWKIRRLNETCTFDGF